MQERTLFEYAVIRVVPKVEREEFLNVGVILFCSKQKFLQTLFHLDEARIKAFAPTTDIQELRDNLCAFQRITSGEKDSGPIGAYDQASRFRWLTATRSTVVQCSKVHPGLCRDAQETLNKLYHDLVL
ncbi:DUF3037 domain-containing protein [Pedobacter sp. MW01-1-1]|uniref:DUF3037 domain-containing protein n=1 Tax=Pedobacter sp. MW01-1-1 TaxID=3383027 RepID=UPI003FF10B81